MPHSIPLRDLSQSGLSALRDVLGPGVGLGLAVNHPSKKRPLACCSINCNFTSVECGDVNPGEIVQNPRMKCTANGIDLKYSEENRIFSCQLRFQKTTARNPEDMLVNVPSALLSDAVSGVYVEALFHYQNELYEVVSIEDGAVVTATLQTETVEEVRLPINLVHELVAQLGK